MSKWMEIRNDYVEDDQIEEGFVIKYIDAWQTEDDNENGSTIATIKFSCDDKNNSTHTELTYFDNTAKTDSFAQEIIQEGIESLKRNYPFLINS